MSEIEPQKRARMIAMSDAERDAHLAGLLVCRVGTISADGAPHVSALWYVWDGGALWLYSIIKSQRWANLQRDRRVSVVIDAGEEYFELRGVELIGEVELVGEQPRWGEPRPDLDEPERLFAQRYTGGAWLGYDQRHAWLRLRPRKQVSWDFRKLNRNETVFNPNRK
jgi:hypothetical protein